MYSGFSLLVLTHKRRSYTMKSRVHPEYTDFLVGAPERRNWPLVPLVGVGATSVIAALAFIFMIIGMLPQ